MSKIFQASKERFDSHESREEYVTPLWEMADPYGRFHLECWQHSELGSVIIQFWPGNNGFMRYADPNIVADRLSVYSDQILSNKLKTKIMGYTHYWEVKQTPNKSEEVKEVLVRGLNTIVQRGYINNIIQLEDDNFSPPRVEFKGNNIVVVFNGIGSEGHETFYFNSSDDWTFCKTSRKPYDVYVMGCLLLLKEFYGTDMILTTDGTLGEWQESADFLQDGWGQRIDLHQNKVRLKDQKVK